jgi:hypothetical protein
MHALGLAAFSSKRSGEAQGGRNVRTEAGETPAGTHGGPDECQEKNY